jgi:PAS domain S-box-containing protein
MLVFFEITDFVSLEAKCISESIKNTFFINLSYRFTNNENPTQLIEFVTREARRFINFEFLTLYLVEGDLLVSHFTTDPEFKIRGKSLTCKIGTGLSGLVAKVRKAITINDSRNSHITQVVAGTTDTDESLISVPLISNDILYGVITISAQSMNMFSKEDEDNLCEIANFIAIIYEKMSLHNKLYKSENRFLSLINESVLGIMILHGEKIRFISRKMREFLNYDDKYLIDRNIISLVVETSRSIFIAQLTSYHLNTDTGIFDIEFYNSDKNVVVLELSFTTIEYEGQVSILLTANDVTKRVEMNKNLVQNQKLESLGALTSGIAHDFKNILAGIMGAADLMMLKSEENSQIYNYAKVIKSSAHRGASLSQQLLNFGSTRKQLDEVFDLNDVLRETIQIVTYTFNKNIHIEYNMANFPLYFEGDIVKVQQCILNLCVNARDAMPDGGILTIATKFIDDVDEVKDLWPDAYRRAFNFIQISDTGGGIPEHIQESIFKAFFTTKEKNKGTGLGLSTTKQIIDDYNGHITLRSKMGEGTSFYILLPWEEKVVEQIEDISVSVNIKLHTILLVDDELVILEVAKELLEEIGCTVYTTDNGFEALEILDQHPEISLALIDRIMPKMDGFTLLKKIKEIKPNLKVIFASGFITESDTEEFRKHGAFDFIQKPYKLEELLKLLNNV